MPGGIRHGTDASGADAPLPGPFRLASNGYKGIFARRQTFYGRTVTMWIARRADADRRVGVVVSKRTLRRAVDRNRAKRLMREAFRLRRHLLAPDVEMILVARAGIAGRQCREVMRDLEILFKRAGVRQ